MCGRYTLTLKFSEIEDELGLKDSPAHPASSHGEWKGRYNIAPTQVLPVVIQKDGHRALEWMRWGLVPFWAKDPSIGNKMINARGETVAEKPAFKNAFRKRRCLIPTDGFYEWKKTGKVKTPIWIRPEKTKVFCLAGLWENWNSPSGEVLETFTILTTSANPFMKKIHDRMPLILSHRDEKLWLDPGTSEEKLLELIHPYSEKTLIAHAVSRAVNTPSNDHPECIQSVASEERDDDEGDDEEDSQLSLIS
ncbi:MAG: SOS response-associated peptidase [Methylotenera sp.]|nr:SOS response-associated peptidase [Oligoflexia bacterium]